MKTILSILFIFLFIHSVNAQTESADDNYAGVTILFPMANSFHYHDYFAQMYSNVPPNAQKWGILGAGIGGFYQGGRNRYELNLVLPADIDHVPGYNKGGSPATIRTLCLEAVIHHRLYKKVRGIVGLNYIRYFYEKTGIDFRYYPSISKKDHTVGVSIGAEYACSPTFSLDVMYRPAIISFNSGGYKSIFSFGCTFNIPFRKKWG